MPETDQRTIELIQRIVDAEATALEREELDALMASSVATRAEYESVRDLVRRLDTFPMAEAPGLRDEILEKLRGRAVVSFHSRKRRTVFGLAWAAAAAVIIAIGIEQFRSPEGVDPGQAGATMTQVEDRRPLLTSAQTAASWPVASREVVDGVVLTVRKEGDEFAFTIEPANSDLSLSWETQQWTFSTATPGWRYDDANKTSGVARFGVPADQGTVVLRRTGVGRGTAVVQVSRSGQQILRKSISFE